MNLCIFAASTLAAIAVFATPAAAQVRFADQTPEQVLAKIAGQCMERDHTVIDLTANKLTCEASLNHDDRADILIRDFRHLGRYSRQVRLMFDFLAFPTKGGTMVQPRQWTEAVINGDTRTHQRSGEFVAVMNGVLEQLAEQ